MAAIQLMPGGGNRYSSEVLTAVPAGNAMADELIVDQNSDLAFQQICAGGPGGTFQPQVRLSSSMSWMNYGTTVTVGDGIEVFFRTTDRPFSRLRFQVANITGLGATVTFQLLVQGYSAGGARL
jgi:hypothetical protein